MKRAPYYLDMDISIYYAAEYLEKGLYGREISGTGLDILAQYGYKAQRITPDLLDTAFSSLCLSDNYIPVYKKYWWFAKDPDWLRQHKYDAFQSIDKDLHSIQMANTKMTNNLVNTQRTNNLTDTQMTNTVNSSTLENGTKVIQSQVNDPPKVSKISHVINPYETAV